MINSVNLIVVGHLFDQPVIQAVTLLVPNRAAKRKPVLPIGK